MYGIKGIVNGLEVGTIVARAKKRLAHLNSTGKITTTLAGSNASFPLAEDLAADDLTGALQMTGIAEVYVETYNGIVAGGAVGVGATGVGIAQAVEGAFQLGIALVAPTANGQTIPVLIAPVAAESTIY